MSPLPPPSVWRNGLHSLRKDFTEMMSPDYLDLIHDELDALDLAYGNE